VQKHRVQGNVALTAHTIFALAFGLGQLRPIAHELGAAKSIQRPEAMARHVLGIVLHDVRLVRSAVWVRDIRGEEATNCSGRRIGAARTDALRVGEQSSTS